MYQTEEVIFGKCHSKARRDCEYLVNEKLSIFKHVMYSCYEIYLLIFLYFSELDCVFIIHKQ